MVDVEKILIIGNGFDLAHGLRTGYNDFLNFIKVADKRVKTIESDKQNQTIIELLNYGKNQGKSFFESGEWSDSAKISLSQSLWGGMTDDDVKLANEIYTMVWRQNVWIRYFLEKEAIANKGWIDFESEIGKIIKAFDINFEDLCQGKEVYGFDAEDDLLLIREMLNAKLPEEVQSDLEYVQAEKEILRIDLLELIRGLEIYLLQCVEVIEPLAGIDIIEGLDVDGILSFNYTNTFKRVYDKTYKSVGYSYIHGRINKHGSLAENNMVLGIDDYLLGEAVNENVEFVAFKKYFQRIVKRPDCNYKQWLRDGHIEAVHIYGHSLDVTDKDVLSEIINIPEAKTTIYYHSQEAFEKQVANLVKVLGRDSLIEKAGNELITFCDVNEFSKEGSLKR